MDNTRSGSGNLVATTDNTRKRQAVKRKSHKVFVILLMLIAVSLTSLFLPVFNVKEVEVIGNEKIETQDIVVSSGIMKEINIFRANITDAKNNISQISYIDTVDIKRSLPNRIVINVTERKPVGYIPFMGSYILIDKRGHVLEVVAELRDNHIPFIGGLKFDRFKLGKTIQVDDDKKLEMIVSCLKEILNYELLHQVSEIDVHDIDNIQLNIQSRIVVSLGDGTDVNYKICFLKEILKELNEGERGYIDLSIEKPTFKPIN